MRICSLLLSKGCPLLGIWLLSFSLPPPPHSQKYGTSYLNYAKTWPSVLVLWTLKSLTSTLPRSLSALTIARHVISDHLPQQLRMHTRTYRAHSRSSIQLHTDTLHHASYVTTTLSGMSSWMQTPFASKPSLTGTTCTLYRSFLASISPTI